MRLKNIDHASFSSEMSQYEITAQEFFSTVLLDSLERNFDLKNVLISYFTTDGEFLSWTSANQIMLDCEEHPYRRLFPQDAVRSIIYREAVKDKLTYFDVEPRLYKSTDIIPASDYDQSPYVQFIEEHFQAHYSLTMAFGINAYIQVAFFKSREEGDFTESEVQALEKIYVYLADSYKNFKKYEQAKIVSNIQDEVITSGEKAYLITDDFMHVMSYNYAAKTYLEDILGPSVLESISSETPCSWLPFLLGTAQEHKEEKCVHTRLIKNYIFKVYTYDQHYSNQIIDRYHWITISQKDDGSKKQEDKTQLPLTPTERRVADLLNRGLTYQAIADELVVSYHTVKKHVQNIYSKCGVKSRFELYNINHS